MYLAFRSALAQLFTGASPAAPALDEPTDVTHLLEAVTAPLPIVAGAPPREHGELLLQLEWCDELGEEDDPTEHISERRARQLLLHAGIDLEETVSDRGLGRAWGADGTQVFLSA